MTRTATIEGIARSHAYLSPKAFAGKYRIAHLVQQTRYLAKGERPAPLLQETVDAAYADYAREVRRFHGKSKDVQTK